MKYDVGFLLNKCDLLHCVNVRCAAHCIDTFIWPNAWTSCKSSPSFPWLLALVSLWHQASTIYMIVNVVTFITLHNYSIILLSTFIILCIISVFIYYSLQVCTLSCHQSHHHPQPPPCHLLVITILLCFLFIDLTVLYSTYNWYYFVPVFLCLTIS